MFTGIVSAVGVIRSNEARGDARIIIESEYDSGTIAMGASIACSGCCLTVVDQGRGWFAVDVSGESVARTAKGMWSAGRRLNLERAMKIGDELGGHIVTGHVDGVGTVASVIADGGSHRIDINVSNDIAPFIAAKGSVTIDGVSLTVNNVSDADGATVFAVNIIPHTWSITALDELAAGREVNIEIDILARYLKRMSAFGGN